MIFPLAFQVDLGREHAALMDKVRELQEAVAGSREGGPADLVSRLTAVRKCFADHVAFEEQGGYMAPVLERAPHLHRVVQELLSEHRTLTQSLDTLLENAQAAVKEGRLDDAWRKGVQDWVARVCRHEARENTLVLESCNRDEAAED